MAGIEKANGHRPSGLLHLLDPALRMAPHPKQEEVAFDLEEVLSSVVRLESQVPPDSFSARTLGTERQGNAVMIDKEGMFLTIGYLVVDANHIVLHSRGGKSVQAELVGYNHESGLAIIHSQSDMGLKPVKLGDSDMLSEQDYVIMAAYGGPNHAISGSVVSRREFAGSWEYLLNRAIFTAPLHPNWSGAGLFGRDGTLRGIGSLWVNDAEVGRRESPGNMFVPINLLKPIYDDLISHGMVTGPTRPWLGIYTAEAMERLFVSGVTPDGPAEDAGIEPGDLVVGIENNPVTTLSEMYEQVWSAGVEGDEILINIRRDGESMDIRVISGSRYRFMQRRKQH
ncbi:MAG: S1C family serine protease [Proteobacteria bacterium]|nr:S1C family serine protease [Pseudomonadota bacterium]